MDKLDDTWPTTIEEFNLLRKEAQRQGAIAGGRNGDKEVKQANGKLGGQLGGKLGGDAVAVPVIIITEDGRQFEYSNQQACADALKLRRQNVNKYVDDGKLHKIKSLGCKCIFKRKKAADNE